MVLIAVIMLANAVACYFIGVRVGRLTAGKRKYPARGNPVEIAHVEYDDAQLGREK